MAFLLAAQHGFVRSSVIAAFETSDTEFKPKDKEGVLRCYCYDGENIQVKHRLERIAQARKEQWYVLTREKNNDIISTRAFRTYNDFCKHLQRSFSKDNRQIVGDYCLEGALLLFHNLGGFDSDFDFDSKADAFGGLYRTINDLTGVLFQVYFFKHSAFYSETEVCMEMPCTQYLRKCFECSSDDLWDGDVLPHKSYRYCWCDEFFSKAGYFLIKEKKPMSEGEFRFR